MTTTDRTETDIASLALDLIGEPPITDLENPGNEIERRIARLYGDARDLVLKAHWWTCARRTEDLAAIADPPKGPYASQFQLPEDCLIVWTLAGREDGFERVPGPGAGRLASNAAAPARLVYGARLSAGETPVELAHAIAARLAVLASTGPGIETSGRKRQDLEAIADERLQDALDVVGTEGGQDAPFQSRFIDALNGYCPQRGGR